MWIKLKNRLYNLDRVLSIESENVVNRGKLCIILYYKCNEEYTCIYFDDKVERDNVFKKIQELITNGGCSLYDFDKDNVGNVKSMGYEMLESIKGITFSNNLSEENKELEAWKTIKNNYLLHNALVGNEIDIIESALKRNNELKEEKELLEIIRDNFDLWIEPKYRATLQFLQCCSLTQSDYEKLIEYFGEPRDD